MKNRKSLYLFIGILLIAFFGVSYSLTNYINKNDIEKNDLLQTSMTTNLKVVTNETEFIFKIKYKDNEVVNMVLGKHFNDSTKLNGKTEEELNEFFKNQGYIVDSMSKKQIVFKNYSDKYSYSYSGNRYFLGVYNDLVTIYKTDKNGDVVAHKIFNSNVYGDDGKQRQYNFESVDSGELRYKRIDELKEKAGLIKGLIRGTKSTKDIDSSQVLEVDQEFESGEFKTAEKAFDYARSLLES